MYKVILFAGTAEGRSVAEYLQKQKIETKVCVATEYGERLLSKEEGQFLSISHNRLEQEEMEALMREMEEGLVIDATHPYAKVVTENIRNACQNTGTEYLRVIREESVHPAEGKTVRYVEDIPAAAAFLGQTEGNVLVTTGSKELAVYTTVPNYQERIYARVLSLASVVEECKKLGFEGKHLICMQGPFSRELNVAMLRQFQIAWMVTKESGKTGGFSEKAAAAEEAGCGLIVVGRPEKEIGKTVRETLEILAERFGICSPVEEKRTVSLVGIGMGNPDTLTVEGKNALWEAQLLIGAGRMVEGLSHPGQQVVSAYRPEEICTCIQKHPEVKKVAVAFSGDVGFYSGARKLLETLKRELPEVERKVYSGLSSMIYFCGKLETEWEDIFPISLHGRERNLVGLLQEHPRIFAIVGNRDGIGKWCRKLTDYGMGETRVWIGERLSYPEERIRWGCAADFADRETDPLSVVLLEWDAAGEAVRTHGICDEAFERGKVPMTKEEVRSVSLSKLRLTSHAVVYDIGAGTGSVSVEMALQAVEGTVYAIEKKEEAVRLLEKNKKKFRADNMEILQGMAPEVLKELPAPTHAFIGGSSGNLKEILTVLLEKNPKVRIVINCITLETVAEAIQCIKMLSLKQVDIVQVSTAKGKKAGAYHLMMGQNPVYVISCSGVEIQEETDGE